MSDLYSPAERLESLLPKIMRSLYRTDESDPLNELPMAQLRLVRVLFCGPRTPSDLGEELHMSPSAVAQMLARLEDAGLVVRECDVADRRVRRVRLSEQGVLLWISRKEKRVARVQEVLDHMPPRRVDALLEVLEEFQVAAVVGAAGASLQVEADIERPVGSV